MLCSMHRFSLVINNGYNPRTGSGMFAGGSGATASLSQTVNILGGVQNYDAAQLDAGTLKVEIKFWYQNYYQWLGTDVSQVIVTFRSATNTVLGTTVDSGQQACTSSSPGWCPYSNTVNLPVGTRSIQYEMRFVRKTGTTNDAYIDDNSLRII